MNEKKLRLGLIGKDVSKSLSERIHTFILKEWGIACDYGRFSVSAEEFDGAIKTLMREYDGFNITIHHKGPEQLKSVTAQRRWGVHEKAGSQKKKSPLWTPVPPSTLQQGTTVNTVQRNRAKDCS